MKLILFLLILSAVSSICFAQKKGEAHSNKDAIGETCNTCIVDNGTDNTNILTYDAKGRCFKFTNASKKTTPLNDLEDFRIYYKKPFKLKIINLNRYLYNVNLGNSDVTFTSNQSEIMQQYFLRGSSNETPAVPNTHADGLSANQGDQIFGLIASFKPELDKLFILIGSIPPIDIVIDAKNDVVNGRSSLMKSSNLKELQKVKRFNDYNDELDVIINTLNKQEKDIANAKTDDEKDAIYNIKYMRTMEQFKQKAESIVKEIDGTNKPAYRKLRNQPNYVEFKTSVSNLIDIPLTITEEKGKPTADSNLLKKSEILFEKFEKLENYYNGFIDDKIRVYSLCSESFECCGEIDKKKGFVQDTLTYSYFNSLLTEINKAYAKLRDEAIKLPETQLEPTTPPKMPDIMKVTASDFTFDRDGKIIGIKLAQGGDAAKKDPAKKKSDQKTEILEKIDSLGTLWFAFEKSVSPEFIMRRILFRRNIVAENMSYTSPPIYPYGDRMRLVFNIVASDSAKKNGVILDDMTTESLDFRVHGKAHFSFSAGTFVALGESMRSATYEFRQVAAQGTNIIDANSPYRLANTGKGSVPIGANAQANITGAVRSGFYLGGSIGVGVTVEPNIKVGYLAGLTASIGTYHQFHITAGAVAMTVDKLKENFKGSTALYTSIPGGSVYTQAVKPGFFLSFSYTVFKVKTSSNGKDGLINQTGIMVK